MHPALRSFGSAVNGLKGRAAALGLLASLAAGAAGAEPSTDLLQYPWHVSTSTPNKTEIALAHEGATVVYTLKNLQGNRDETFPHMTIDLGAAQDWRGYRTLKCRMRLTSDAPSIMAGGKDLMFCFYDGQTRHEMLNIPVQQGVSVHLKGGEWQDVTLNLRPLGRAEVGVVDLYTYIAPYGITHQYKIEVAQCELVRDNRPVFDGEGMSGPLSGGGGEPLKKLATSDGLQLQVAKDGGVTGLAIGGQEIGGAGEPGGVLVRDHASEAPPVAVRGETRAEGDALIQRATLDPLGLKVESRYQAEGDRIHVSLKATNLRKDTRLLTLYFALPLQKKAWSWGKDINQTVAIPADSQRPYEEATAQYPLACLTSPDAAVALAIPLDQPRNYRLAYNEPTGLFYAAFDVALTDLKNPDGHSLNEAACDVYLYPADPRWGFRSALQNYYAAFPQWFVKRTKRDGGWEIGRPKLTPEQVIASGCRFSWGTAPDLAAWNTQNGILNTVYIEPEYIQISMTDLQPSDAAALERLKNLAAGDAAEWKKIEHLHYTVSGSGDPYAKAHGLQPYHQMLAQAALGSGLVTADGRPSLGVGYRGGWIGENGLAMMVPCNLDPQIPHGRGQAASALLEASARAHAVENHVTTDGWALDSYVCDDSFDYQANNFRYSPFPITFEQGGTQPAVPIRLTMAAWARELAASTGKLLFGNVVGNITFSVPYLDIFGSEEGWVTNPAYLRSMAHHKSMTYLPYTPKPDLDVFFNFLYGVYPGRGLVQEQYEKMVPVLDTITPAGWEPVTDAVTDAPHVRVERFGSGKTCYLVFHNNDPAAKAFQVTADAQALQTTGQKVTVLFGPQKGQEIAATHGAFPLQLGSRETCVVKLD
jgi:hypothetical protein